jgi:ribosomal protein S9
MLTEKFYIGRRKSSIAKLRIVLGEGIILINKKNMVDYMQNNPNCVLLFLHFKMFIFKKLILF